MEDPAKIQDFNHILRKYYTMLSLEERLAGIEPDDVLRMLTPEQRLAGLGPEQRLAGLAPSSAWLA